MPMSHVPAQDLKEFHEFQEWRKARRGGSSAQVTRERGRGEAVDVDDLRRDLALVPANRHEAIMQDTDYTIAINLKVSCLCLLFPFD